MRATTLTTLTTTLVLLGIVACGPAGVVSVVSQRGGSHYVVRQRSDEVVIVFVHGALGDARNTWRNISTGAYWPTLMRDDKEVFGDASVYVHEYRSPFLDNTYSVDELADDMRRVLSNDGVLNHKEIVFLAHSMGGLVVRSFLVKYREFAEKVEMIYFFATPTTGAAVANIASLISRNPHFKMMKFPMRPEEYLGDLLRQWLAAGHNRIGSYCAYEKYETVGVMIVDQASAAQLCNRRLDPIDEDHINIVKPSDRRHPSYISFRDAFKDSRFRLVGKKPRTQVSITCQAGILPPPQPHSTRYVLYLFPTMISGLLQEFAGAGDPSGRPAAPAPPEFIYRCDVRNHGSEILFNLRMILGLKFTEAVKPAPGPDAPGAIGGAVIVNRGHPIEIPVPLEASSGRFEFYIRNGSPHFVNVTLPEYATLQDGQQVPVARSPSSAPLFFGPKLDK